MAGQSKWKRSHRDVDLYFEGYQKQTVTDPATGKRRTEYRYTGDYYLFRLEPAELRRCRAASAALTLAASAAFAAAYGIGPQGSARAYVAVPALLSLIPLCYLLLGLWGFVRRGSPKMTIREYTFGLGRMKKSLWAVALLWAAALVGQAVYMIANRDAGALELGCAGLAAVSLAALAGAWRVQERVLSACIHRADSKYDDATGAPKEED